MKELRRLSLQLTPLLDLLLIVIFAQHMEVLQNAQSAQQAVSSEREEFAVERERQIRELQQQREELESETAARKRSTDQIRREYDERFQSILDQQQKAGSALASALNLPGEVIEQLSRLRADGRPGDAEQLKAASERLQQVIESRGTEFLQFLIRFDEMQKHVSIWEVHLQANGKVLFTDGEQSHTISFETEEEFATRIFNSSKSFSTPRTLVLILLSYGDAQAGIRRTATDAMPTLTGLLRQDAARTKWFDFSLLGFRPQGPVFTRTAEPPRTTP